LLLAGEERVDRIQQLFAEEFMKFPREVRSMPMREFMDGYSGSVQVWLDKGKYV
jgi:hypothetical protein